MNLEKVNQRITDEEILQSFLAKWPINRLDQITLDQYNDIGNKETFCQYVETKTRVLGSIKGPNSTKFGIYKRLNKEKMPVHTVSNADYTWLPRYNFIDKNEIAAFENVKKNYKKLPILQWQVTLKELNI